MQPCAFQGGEEGILCCGDRGSLKDDVSIVKERLCVWGGSQCGHCQRDRWDLLSKWGGRIILILYLPFCCHCGHKVAILIFFFLTRERVGCWGICCLSRLWYGCVGGGCRQAQERDVITSYKEPLCMSVVKASLMHDKWKATKGPFHPVP